MKCSLMIRILMSFFLVSFPAYGDILDERCHFGKCHVSFIHLLAFPTQLQEKVVVVKGVASIQGGRYAIYLDLGSEQNGILENAVLLELGTDRDSRIDLLDERYVLVEGVFDSKDRGQSNTAIGTVKRITRIHPVR